MCVFCCCPSCTGNYVRARVPTTDTAKRIETLHFLRVDISYTPSIYQFESRSTSHLYNIKMMYINIFHPIYCRHPTYFSPS